MLHIPRDVLALVRFLLVLTVGASVFLLWSLDEAILALLPLLPNRLYRRFLEAVERAYHPILFLTFTIGLLWGVGYHNLAGFLLQRSWAVMAVFLAAVFLHHLSLRWVKQHILPDSVPTDAALAFARALVAIVTYVVTAAAALLVLNLLGLLPVFFQMFSAPLLTVGTTHLSGLVVLQVHAAPADQRGCIFGARFGGIAKGIVRAVVILQAPEAFGSKQQIVRA